MIPVLDLSTSDCADIRLGTGDATAADSSNLAAALSRIAAHLCDCPTGMLTEPTLGISAASLAWPAGDDTCMITAVAATAHPLIVPDATRHPTFRDNLLVRSFPGVRFFAGIPVLGAMGVAAVLSVFDYRPRDAGLSHQQLELLTDLAALAADRLRLEERERTTPLERVQFEAVAATSASAVLWIDGADRIVNWNAAAESLLAAYADDLYEAHAPRHLPHWHQLAAACALPGRSDTDGSLRHRETPVVRLDGRRLRAIASVAPTCGGPVQYRVSLDGIEPPLPRL